VAFGIPTPLGKSNLKVPMPKPVRECDHQSEQQQWQQQQQQPFVQGESIHGTSSSIVGLLPRGEGEQRPIAVSQIEERLEGCENLIGRSFDKLTRDLEGLRAGLAGDAAGLPEARAVVFDIRDLAASRDEHAKEITELQHSAQSLTARVDEMHHVLQQNHFIDPVFAAQNPPLPPPAVAPLDTVVSEAATQPATLEEMEALRTEFRERHSHLLADLEKNVNQALAQIHDRVLACEQAVFEHKDDVHESHARFVDEALAATAERLAETERRQETLQLALEDTHGAAKIHIEEKHAEIQRSMDEELKLTQKNSVNEVLEMAKARDSEIVEAFAHAKRLHEKTDHKIDRFAEALRACESQQQHAWQHEQQQQQSLPTEFEESTRQVGPVVSSSGGDFSEARFIALLEEHCAPLVNRADKLERRLDAARLDTASRQHLAEVDRMRADHETLHHGVHHAKVEGLERAVDELGRKSEFNASAYTELEQRLAASQQAHNASIDLQGLLAGFENLAEKTEKQANGLMACKMKVASCDDHCALLDDHCVNLMEHADLATQKHDRLLGELMEHRERVCLQEQGVQQELHRLQADLHRRDGFSRGDLVAVETHDRLLSELMEHRERVCLQEHGVQQELHRLKADVHSRDGYSGGSLKAIEARLEARLEDLATNVASQMKFSQDETHQVRLLLAGVQKAWGLAIRNPRPSRRSRHAYG